LDLRELPLTLRRGSGNSPPPRLPAERNRAQCRSAALLLRQMRSSWRQRVKASIRLSTYPSSDLVRRSGELWRPDLWVSRTNSKQNARAGGAMPYHDLREIWMYVAMMNLAFSRESPHRDRLRIRHLSCAARPLPDACSRPILRLRPLLYRAIPWVTAAGLVFRRGSRAEIANDH